MRKEVLALAQAKKVSELEVLHMTVDDYYVSLMAFNGLMEERNKK